MVPERTTHLTLVWQPGPQTDTWRYRRIADKAVRFYLWDGRFV